jgi:spermidine/putrescine transport system substrate-binding protein
MTPASIRFLNWIDYVAPTVLERFETETGIHVEEVYFHSEVECVARVAAGEAFDVVLSTDYASAGLRKAGLLQPLDMDRLPNWRHVTNERLRRPPHDPETDGHKYTSVFMFGTEGFAVRLDKVPAPQLSWEMLFDSSRWQDISMIDGSREVLAPPLFLLGAGPNCVDVEVVARATTMALEQRPLVITYDSKTVTQRIVAGVSLVHCWDGDVAAAISAGITSVRYVLPREGYRVWADAPCIPANAPDPDAAHLFLDFLLRPEVAAENADFAGFQPVVPDAEPLITSLVQRSMRPTDAQVAQGTFLEDLGEVNAIYEDSYRKVRES